MTTEELLEAFEAGTLPGEVFRHAQHVEVAWAYLRRYPASEALSRFAGALQRFAAANGAPGKYDAALTTAWFALVAERMTLGGESEWRTFAERHPDLLISSRPVALAE